MHSHPDTSSSVFPNRPPPKKRGSYNCGRCGVPKKGHVCAINDALAIVAVPSPAPPRAERLRRALSFDDLAADPDVGQPEEEWDANDGTQLPVPPSCMAEVLRRLSPKEMMRVACVCRGWRDLVRRAWYSTEEIRIKVDRCGSSIGFVGSVLNRCEGLVRLRLTMESDADATVLACVAFSCPNLESFEMKITNNAVNRITGDELGRFVSEKRSLSVVKIEGCVNLGSLSLCSSSLSTLWLSDLQCISKTIISCPNLQEISLDFAKQDNDSTDLVSIIDCLGRSCLKLRNIHIASSRLCNEVVLALAGANLRGLRMLSLVLGAKMTDASVAAIVSTYEHLELLDLSGSSISDSGIGMICNVFPQTLSRLLLALCPNITSSGIQFAAAQLPFLQLFDCGMSIRDLSSENQNFDDNFRKLPPASNSLSIYQKLLIKHVRLKKLSLWGCSGLDALYLNCPELDDLNLNLCSNLNPDTLVIDCPKLKNIHASGCQGGLVGEIRRKVLGDFSTDGNRFQRKRLADGSKRVQIPQFLTEQASEDGKRKRFRLTSCSFHLNGS